MFALEISRLKALFEWTRIGSKVVKTMRRGRFYIFSSPKFTTLVPQPENGHFYFARTGHYNMAPTWITSYNLYYVKLLKEVVACNEGISCKDAALCSTLESLGFPASIRLLTAGVFLGRPQTDNAGAALPGQIDRRADYANSSRHCGSGKTVTRERSR